MTVSRDQDVARYSQDYGTTSLATSKTPKEKEFLVFPALLLLSTFANGQLLTSRIDRICNNKKPPVLLAIC